MAKTYAPQMAKMLQRVARYYSKHAPKIQAAASAQQNADLTTIVNAINNSWLSVVTIEEP